MRTEKDYEDLLKLFNKHNVRYCIIGAFAVALYAKPRYTKDIDIFVSTELRNARRILSALNEFGFRNVGLNESDFTKKGNIIQLGYEPVRVDVLTSLPGCSFMRVWKSRRIGKYGRQRVNFISLNELIKNKRVSKRKQDKADLEVLLKARKRVETR